jgi:hypothetical protein
VLPPASPFSSYRSAVATTASSTPFSLPAREKKRRKEEERREKKKKRNKKVLTGGALHSNFYSVSI